eukprot:m.299623 g.299623  ORF g.299623 m.299623 type:complete len:512 (-) comp15872_c2_seq1:3643-5178(-)
MAEAAQQARAEQLEVLEKYLAGEETVFVNHQGKEFTDTYDASVFENPKASSKISIDPTAAFLSAVTLACESNELDELEELLSQGAKVEAKNPEGLTALHTACIENNVKVATWLMQQGADIHAVDNDWWTPLHAAAACGSWRIAKGLLKAGADVGAINSDGDMPIDLVEDDERTMQVIQEAMDEAGISEEVKEDLIEQPHKKFIEDVQAAIDSKEDLNALDSNGVSMLHIAASNGWQDALELLLKNGADPNIKDNDEGNTPMHLAVFFLEFKAIEMLAAHGADPHAQNRYCEPPINLTEDPVMIRAVNALEKKQKVEQVPDHPARMSTFKKKTLQKVDLRKIEAEVEARNAASMYEEIKFGGRERRASEWAERDKSIHYEEISFAKLQANREAEEQRQRSKRESERKSSPPKRPSFRPPAPNPLEAQKSKDSVKASAAPADDTIAEASETSAEETKVTPQTTSSSSKGSSEPGAPRNGMYEEHKLSMSSGSQVPIMEVDDSEDKKGGCCVVS